MDQHELNGARPGPRLRLGSAWVGTCAALLGLELCAAPLVQAQDLIETLQGEAEYDGFGLSSDGAGDVDADGVPDFVVAAPGAGEANIGIIYVYSGATGAPIWEFSDYPWVVSLGYAVSGAGDVDQDGYHDVIASSINSGTIGKAYVISGASGAELYAWSENSSGDSFGSCVGDVGDVDGDGHADVAVGSAGDDEPSDGFGQGTLQVFSGATGLRIYEFTGMVDPPDSSDHFGGTVCGAGDIDGDGFCDVFGGASYYSAVMYSGFDGSVLFTCPTGGEYVNKVASLAEAGDLGADGVREVILGTSEQVNVYSGPTGIVTMTFVDPDPFVTSFFGKRVAGGGDLDGDGYLDVLVGAPECDASQAACTIYPGRVQGFSGLDGSELFTIWSDAVDDDAFASGLGIVGDVNGDDCAEFIVGIGYANSGTQDAVGRAELWSPVDLAFRSPIHALNLAPGGTQPLRLQPGAEWAGSLYLVAGTATNIVPELVLGGLTLPLVIDAYTLLTLNQPNVPPFTATLGFLGVDGKANAAFVLPPGLDPILAGTVLHHAFVLLGASGELSFSSNSVPLTIL